MSTNCVITLDHPNNIYHSGNSLNGHVKLETKKSKSIRGISIKIVGYGKVFWSEPRGKTSAHFKSHEQFLNSVTYVMGSPEGDSFDLQPGIHEYTFTCQLPQQLPTSMKESNSKIIYKVIVIINRRLRFDNVFQKEFLVSQISDLNLNLNNMQPRRSTGIMEIASCFGCCCFNGTEIKAELIIPSGGYVSGQVLPFQLIVYNDSNFELSGAKVKLMKCYTYKSTEPYIRQKKTDYTIDIKYCDHILRQTNKEFKNIFILPFLLPTNRTKFIRIDYKLRAKIRVFGYSTKKFHLEVPVTIGTIPIDNYYRNNLDF